MFGPVMTSMRRASSSARSLGTNGVLAELLDHRVAAAVDLQHAARRPARARTQLQAVGALGQGARAHRAAPARRRCPAARPSASISCASSASYSSFSRASDLLARAQHLVLEALELRRDEALGGLHRLPAQVVGRHALGLRARDLDEEALHAVVAELQAAGCRCARARAPRAPAGTRRCCVAMRRSSSSVGVVARRRSRRRRAGRRRARRRWRAPAARARRRARRCRARSSCSSGESQRGEQRRAAAGSARQRRAQLHQVARPRDAQRHARQDALDVADGAAAARAAPRSGADSRSVPTA